MARRPTTVRTRSAARHNIIKAQYSRLGRREPRQLGRYRVRTRPKLRSRIR